jgi:hypothetical protein
MGGFPKGRGDPAPPVGPDHALSAERREGRNPFRKKGGRCRNDDRRSTSLQGRDEGALPLYDAMEVRVGDAPRADEILIAVAFTDSGRPLARVPGLTLEEVLLKG